MALNERQQRFVAEYLISGNATEAYKKAGYRPRNDETARVNACRLLTTANIQDALATARAARSERLEITADDVVRGLHGEATFTGEGSSHSARVSAWTALGKHLGMFRDRLDVTASITIQTVAGVDQGRVLGTAERNGQT